MQMKQAIREIAGKYLRCSIGIAPNRVLAKTASNMMKPDGLVVIEQHELPIRLHGLELTDFPGIGNGIEARLHRYGIRTVPQLCRASRPTLRKAWGSVLGETWWHWLRGDETAIPKTKKKSCGHQHVLPPDLRHHEQARSVAIRLLHKAAARMRWEGYWCTRLTIDLNPPDALCMARCPVMAHRCQTRTVPRHGAIALAPRTTLGHTTLRVHLLRQRHPRRINQQRQYRRTLVRTRSQTHQPCTHNGQNQPQARTRLNLLRVYARRGRLSTEAYSVFECAGFGFAGYRLMNL